MTDFIRTEREGAILTIVIDRPDKMNALTLEMYEEIAGLFTGLADDPATRAVVIRGAGGRAFAAGTDISVFRVFGKPEQGLAYEHRMDQILSLIEQCPVPTIAAIAGVCTGGGAAIAAVCDLRIATRNLRFGFPIARTLGNCLSAVNLARLSALMGPARVKEMIFTARLLGGEEALAAGLVGELVETPEALEARAAELARQIAGHAPLTLAITKELMRRNAQAAGIGEDRDLVAKCYTSADFREGLESFLAKRAPQWTGR
ncbi:MAG: enoyl-CoA hydratase [Hyphomicrobiaceae bacterium]